MDEHEAVGVRLAEAAYRVVQFVRDGHSAAGRIYVEIKTTDRLVLGGGANLAERGRRARVLCWIEDVALDAFRYDAAQAYLEDMCRIRASLARQPCLLVWDFVLRALLSGIFHCLGHVGGGHIRTSADA